MKGHQHNLSTLQTDKNIPTVTLLRVEADMGDMVHVALKLIS